MHDFFALLNEPRRPWLDTEDLKKRFLESSMAFHPDRFHNAAPAEKSEAEKRYADLNSAWQCLSEPRDRLLHLLELEQGGKPRDVQRIPPGTMDLFMEVGQSCQETDAILASRSQITSPMLKVRLFEQIMEQTDKLQALEKKIQEKKAELMAELKTLNARWESAPAPGSADRMASLPIERLEQIYRALSYITRWTEQIRERNVQLAIPV